MTFHAIVSLLDPVAYQKVIDLWSSLESECGLTGMKQTPYPHISWQVASDYPVGELTECLTRLASQTAPFKVLCAGLGVFTSPAPVLYIPVVKDSQILRFHEILWHETGELAKDISLLYSPPLWIPHITLAHRNITPGNVDCVFHNLIFDRYDWQIHLDNLALVCQEGENIGELKLRIPLSG